MYDKNGKLTRAGAEQVIRDGGSAMIGGKLYSKAESLPDEAEFAKGDVAAENAARENLMRQRRELDEQIGRLGAGQSQQPATAAKK